MRDARVSVTEARKLALLPALSLALSFLMGLGKMKEMMWFFQVRRLMDDMAFRTRAENHEVDRAGREEEFEAGLKVVGCHAGARGPCRVLDGWRLVHCVLHALRGARLSRRDQVSEWMRGHPVTFSLAFEGVYPSSEPDSAERERNGKWPVLCVSLTCLLLLKAHVGPDPHPKPRLCFMFV